MKATISTIPHDVFYNPAASLSRAWQERSRTNARLNGRTMGPVLLEPDERKQEAVCSVILTLCLMFSLAVCIAQFAVS